MGAVDGISQGEAAGLLYSARHHAFQDGPLENTLPTKPLSPFKAPKIKLTVKATSTKKQQNIDRPQFLAALRTVKEALTSDPTTPASTDATTLNAATATLTTALSQTNQNPVKAGDLEELAQAITTTTESALASTTNTITQALVNNALLRYVDKGVMPHNLNRLVNETLLATHTTDPAFKTLQNNATHNKGPAKYALIRYLSYLLVVDESKLSKDQIELRNTLTEGNKSAAKQKQIVSAFNAIDSANPDNTITGFLNSGSNVMPHADELAPLVAAYLKEGLNIIGAILMAQHEIKDASKTEDLEKTVQVFLKQFISQYTNGDADSRNAMFASGMEAVTQIIGDIADQEASETVGSTDQVSLAAYRDQLERVRFQLADLFESSGKKSKSTPSGIDAFADNFASLSKAPDTVQGLNHQLLNSKFNQSDASTLSHAKDAVTKKTALSDQLKFDRIDADQIKLSAAHKKTMDASAVSHTEFKLSDTPETDIHRPTADKILAIMEGVMETAEVVIDRLGGLANITGENNDIKQIYLLARKYVGILQTGTVLEQNKLIKQFINGKIKPKSGKGKETSIIDYFVIESKNSTAAEKKKATVEQGLDLLTKPYEGTKRRKESQLESQLSGLGRATPTVRTPNLDSAARQEAQALVANFDDPSLGDDYGFNKSQGQTVAQYIKDIGAEHVVEAMSRPDSGSVNRSTTTAMGKWMAHRKSVELSYDHISAIQTGGRVDPIVQTTLSTLSARTDLDRNSPLSDFESNVVTEGIKKGLVTDDSLGTIADNIALATDNNLPLLPEERAIAEAVIQQSKTNRAFSAAKQRELASIEKVLQKTDPITVLAEGLRTNLVDIKAVTITALATVFKTPANPALDVSNADSPTQAIQLLHLLQDEIKKTTDLYSTLNNLSENAKVILSYFVANQGINLSSDWGAEEERWPLRYWAFDQIVTVQGWTEAELKANSIALAGKLTTPTSITLYDLSAPWKEATESHLLSVELSPYTIKIDTDKLKQAKDGKFTYQNLSALLDNVQHILGKGGENNASFTETNASFEIITDRVVNGSQRLVGSEAIIPRLTTKTDGAVEPSANTTISLDRAYQILDAAKNGASPLIQVQSVKEKTTIFPGSALTQSTPAHLAVTLTTSTRTGNPRVLNNPLDQVINLATTEAPDWISWQDLADAIQVIAASTAAPVQLTVGDATFEKTELQNAAPFVTALHTIGTSVHKSPGNYEIDFEADLPPVFEKINTYRPKTYQINWWIAKTNAKITRAYTDFAKFKTFHKNARLAGVTLSLEEATMSPPPSPRKGVGQPSQPKVFKQVITVPATAQATQLKAMADNLSGPQVVWKRDVPVITEAKETTTPLPISFTTIQQHDAFVANIKELEAVYFISNIPTTEPGKNPLKFTHKLPMTIDAIQAATTALADVTTILTNPQNANAYQIQSITGNPVQVIGNANLRFNTSLAFQEGINNKETQSAFIARYQDQIKNIIAAQKTMATLATYFEFKNDGIHLKESAPLDVLFPPTTNELTTPQKGADDIVAGKLVDQFTEVLPHLLIVAPLTPEKTNPPAAYPLTFSGNVTIPGETAPRDVQAKTIDTFITKLKEALAALRAAPPASSRRGSVPLLVPVRKNSTNKNPLAIDLEAEGESGGSRRGSASDGANANTQPKTIALNDFGSSPSSANTPKKGPAESASNPPAHTPQPGLTLSGIGFSIDASPVPVSEKGDVSKNQAALEAELAAASPPPSINLESLVGQINAPAAPALSAEEDHTISIDPTEGPSQSMALSEALTILHAAAHTQGDKPALIRVGHAQHQPETPGTDGNEDSPGVPEHLAITLINKNKSTPLILTQDLSQLRAVESKPPITLQMLANAIQAIAQHTTNQVTFTIGLAVFSGGQDEMKKVGPFVNAIHTFYNATNTGMELKNFGKVFLLNYNPTLSEAEPASSVEHDQIELYKPTSLATNWRLKKPSEHEFVTIAFGGSDGTNYTKFKAFHKAALATNVALSIDRSQTDDGVPIRKQIITVPDTFNWESQKESVDAMEGNIPSSKNIIWKLSAEKQKEGPSSGVISRDITLPFSERAKLEAFHLAAQSANVELSIVTPKEVPGEKQVKTQHITVPHGATANQITALAENAPDGPIIWTIPNPQDNAFSITFAATPDYKAFHLALQNGTATVGVEQVTKAVRNTSKKPQEKPTQVIRVPAEIMTAAFPKSTITTTPMETIWQVPAPIISKEDAEATLAMTFNTTTEYSQFLEVSKLFTIRCVTPDKTSTDAIVFEKKDSTTSEMISTVEMSTAMVVVAEKLHDLGYTEQSIQHPTSNLQEPTDATPQLMFNLSTKRVAFVGGSDRETDYIKKYTDKVSDAIIATPAFSRLSALFEFSDTGVHLRSDLTNAQLIQLLPNDEEEGTNAQTLKKELAALMNQLLTPNKHPKQKPSSVPCTFIGSIVTKAGAASLETTQGTAGKTDRDKRAATVNAFVDKLLAAIQIIRDEAAEAADHLEAHPVRPSKKTVTRASSADNSDDEDYGDLEQITDYLAEEQAAVVPVPTAATGDSPPPTSRARELTAEREKKPSQKTSVKGQVSIIPKGSSGEISDISDNEEDRNSDSDSEFGDSSDSDSDDGSVHTEVSVARSIAGSTRSTLKSGYNLNQNAKAFGKAKQVDPIGTPAASPRGSFVAGSTRSNVPLLRNLPVGDDDDASVRTTRGSNTHRAPSNAKFASPRPGAGSKQPFRAPTPVEQPAQPASSASGSQSNILGDLRAAAAKKEKSGAIPALDLSKLPSASANPNNDSDNIKSVRTTRGSNTHRALEGAKFNAPKDKTSPRPEGVSKPAEPVVAAPVAAAPSIADHFDEPEPVVASAAAETAPIAETAKEVNILESMLTQIASGTVAEGTDAFISESIAVLHQASLGVTPIISLAKLETSNNKFIAIDLDVNPDTNKPRLFSDNDIPDKPAYMSALATAIQTLNTHCNNGIQFTIGAATFKGTEPTDMTNIDLFVIALINLEALPKDIQVKSGNYPLTVHVNEYAATTDACDFLEGYKPHDSKIHWASATIPPNEPAKSVALDGDAANNTSAQTYDQFKVTHNAKVTELVAATEENFDAVEEVVGNETEVSPAMDINLGTVIKLLNDPTTINPDQNQTIRFTPVGGPLTNLIFNEAAQTIHQAATGDNPSIKLTHVQTDSEAGIEGHIVVTLLGSDISDALANAIQAVSQYTGDQITCTVGTATFPAKSNTIQNVRPFVTALHTLSQDSDNITAPSNATDKNPASPTYYLDYHSDIPAACDPLNTYKPTEYAPLWAIRHLLPSDPPKIVQITHPFTDVAKLKAFHTAARAANAILSPGTTRGATQAPQQKITLPSKGINWKNKFVNAQYVAYTKVMFDNSPTETVDMTFTTNSQWSGIASYETAKQQMQVSIGDKPKISETLEHTKITSSLRDLRTNIASVTGITDNQLVENEDNSDQIKLLILLNNIIALDASSANSLPDDAQVILSYYIVQQGPELTHIWGSPANIQALRIWAFGQITGTTNLNEATIQDRWTKNERKQLTLPIDDSPNLSDIREFWRTAINIISHSPLLSGSIKVIHDTSEHEPKFTIQAQQLRNGTDNEITVLLNEINKALTHLLGAGIIQWDWNLDELQGEITPRVTHRHEQPVPYEALIRDGLATQQVPASHPESAAAAGTAPVIKKMPPPPSQGGLLTKLYNTWFINNTDEIEEDDDLEASTSSKPSLTLKAQVELLKSHCAVGSGTTPTKTHYFRVVYDNTNADEHVIKFEFLNDNFDAFMALEKVKRNEIHTAFNTLEDSSTQGAHNIKAGISIQANVQLEYSSANDTAPVFTGKKGSMSSRKLADYLDSVSKAKAQIAQLNTLALQRLITENVITPSVTQLRVDNNSDAHGFHEMVATESEDVTVAFTVNLGNDITDELLSEHLQNTETATAFQALSTNSLMSGTFKARYDAAIAKQPKQRKAPSGPRRVSITLPEGITTKPMAPPPSKPPQRMEDSVAATIGASRNKSTAAAPTTPRDAKPQSDLLGATPKIKGAVGSNAAEKPKSLTGHNGNIQQVFTDWKNNQNFNFFSQYFTVEIDRSNENHAIKVTFIGDQVMRFITLKDSHRTAAYTALNKLGANTYNNDTYDHHLTISTQVPFNVPGGKPITTSKQTFDGSGVDSNTNPQYTTTNLVTYLESAYATQKELNLIETNDPLKQLIDLGTLIPTVTTVTQDVAKAFNDNSPDPVVTQLNLTLNPTIPQEKQLPYLALYAMGNFQLQSDYAANAKGAPPTLEAFQKASKQELNESKPPLDETLISTVFDQVFPLYLEADNAAKSTDKVVLLNPIYETPAKRPIIQLFAKIIVNILNDPSTPEDLRNKLLGFKAFRHVIGHILDSSDPLSNSDLSTEFAAYYTRSSKLESGLGKENALQNALVNGIPKAKSLNAPYLHAILPKLYLAGGFSQAFGEKYVAELLAYNDAHPNQLNRDEQLVLCVHFDVRQSLHGVLESAYDNTEQLNDDLGLRSEPYKVEWALAAQHLLTGDNQAELTTQYQRLFQANKIQWIAANKKNTYVVANQEALTKTAPCFQNTSPTQKADEWLKITPNRNDRNVSHKQALQNCINKKMLSYTVNDQGVVELSISDAQAGQLARLDGDTKKALYISLNELQTAIPSTTLQLNNFGDPITVSKATSVHLADPLYAYINMLVPIQANMESLAAKKDSGLPSMAQTLRLATQTPSLGMLINKELITPTIIQRKGRGLLSSTTYKLQLTPGLPATQTETTHNVHLAAYAIGTAELEQARAGETNTTFDLNQFMETEKTELRHMPPKGFKEAEIDNAYANFLPLYLALEKKGELPKNHMSTQSDTFAYFALQMQNNKTLRPLIEQILNNLPIEFVNHLHVSPYTSIDSPSVNLYLNYVVGPLLIYNDQLTNDDNHADIHKKDAALKTWVKDQQARTSLLILYKKGKLPTDVADRLTQALLDNPIERSIFKDQNDPEDLVLATYFEVRHRAYEAVLMANQAIQAPPTPAANGRNRTPKKQALPAIDPKLQKRFNVTGDATEQVFFKDQNKSNQRDPNIYNLKNKHPDSYSRLFKVEHQKLIAQLEREIASVLASSTITKKTQKTKLSQMEQELEALRGIDINTALPTTLLDQMKEVASTPTPAPQNVYNRGTANRNNDVFVHQDTGRQPGGTPASAKKRPASAIKHRTAVGTVGEDDVQEFGAPTRSEQRDSVNRLAAPSQSAIKRQDQADRDFPGEPTDPQVAHQNALSRNGHAASMANMHVNHLIPTVTPKRIGTAGQNGRRVAPVSDSKAQDNQALLFRQQRANQGKNPNKPNPTQNQLFSETVPLPTDGLPTQEGAHFAGADDEIDNIPTFGGSSMKSPAPTAIDEPGSASSNRPDSRSGENGGRPHTGKKLFMSPKINPNSNHMAIDLEAEDDYLAEVPSKPKPTEDKKLKKQGSVKKFIGGLFGKK
ncbi:hypothetical protein HOH87_08335 [bacterium]|nr:hypothetical protein [bacterium]